MKLQEGVFLHVLPSKSYKTNRLQFRFAAPFQEETLAGRVLLSNLLEMGNQDFPSAHLFRKKLASLYGATFATQVSQKGQVHCVDLIITYAKSAYLLGKESLLEAILELVEAVLFRPLLDQDSFQSAVFDMEQKNMVSYLLSELEDSFTQADQRVREAFFGNSAIRFPISATPELIQNETASSVYSAWLDLLQKDRVDIFFVGEEEGATLEKKLATLPFGERKCHLQFECRVSQEISSIQISEQKDVNQSVLQIAYELPVVYKGVNYAAFLVFNGLFGLHPHSKLFSVIREQEGLAYTIGTQFDVFTGIYSLYMGISKEDLPYVLKLLDALWEDMETGQFTTEDLEKTKRLLIDSAKVASEKPAYKIEKSYNESVFPDRTWENGEFTDAVKSVSKSDIQELAQLFRVKVTYFLEGIQ